MKKRVIALLLCLVFALSITPISVFADDTTSEEVTEESESTERVPLVTTKASGLDNWGSWNGTSAAKVAGAAEDGTSEAWVLTGGANGGGAQFNLNVGFANANLTHTDDDGNVIAKTNGFIDAAEFGIRYKSVSGFSINLKEEFRKSGSPTLQTKGVWIPSSNGEWATYTIPFSAFAHSDAVEDQWVHHIIGRYSGNFEPVVLMRVEQLNQGADNQMVIDHLFVNWYKEDMVSKVEWHEEPKTTYFQNYDDFNYEQGSIRVYRGGSETEYEVFTLDDPRIEISGYRNDLIYNNDDDNKNLQINVSVLNNSLSYRVRVIPFAPETLTSIQVNEPKTEYFIGDPFDYETGLIQANYSDKDPEFAQLDDINATVEGFDSTTEGEKTITVTYGGQSTNYTINVSPYAAEGVTSIQVENPRKVYTKGDNFYYYDGTVVPYKGSVAQTPLKLYNRYVTITGFDSTETAADQEITVTYSGCTTTYTIDIIETTPPVLRYATMDMTTSSPSIWYNDKCSSELKDGYGEDGISRGWYFTGSGTSQAALTGGWGTGDVQASDGTYVSGLIGTDALAIRYKSDSSISFRFNLEYRASGSATKSTNWASIPASSEWTTAIIPMSAFEPAQTGDSSDEKLESVEWVYNGIKGGYTTNFEPVVRFYVGVGNRTNSDGTAQSTTIDSISALWYDTTSLITGFSFEPERTKYFEGVEFDTSGTATITYKDGTEKKATADELGITFTGYDSSVAGTQTITAEYAGNIATFDIEVVTGGDEVISAVLSEDIVDVYLIGDEFNTSVGSIIITLVNGTQTVVPLSDENVVITGFDSSTQNTKVPVTITYGEHVFELSVRVYKPTLQYSSASFTDGNNTAITSFGGKEIVNANIKVRNRVACETPQTAVIFAAVYSSRGALPLIKKLTDTPIPASQEVTLSATFTAEELENASTIKIIALDGSETISNLLDTVTSINK